MFIKIIAWIWIILGVLFLIKPDFLKKRLQKKGAKKLKKTLFVISLALAITLIVVAFKYQGILPKVLVVLGILGIIKAFLFLKAKSAEKLIEWSAKQPLVLFRVGGGIYLVIGLAILKFAK